MKFRSTLLACVVVVGAWTTPIFAGAPTPGSQVVAQCNADLSDLADDIDSRAADFAADVSAKLTALDNAGRSDDQIIAYAERQIAKLRREEDRAVARANKLAIKCMQRVVRFDEIDLINQITTIDSDRDTAVAVIGADADDAEDTIQDTVDSIVH